SRAVIEASKQCGRNRLMTVDPPQRWAEFVARGDLPASRLVLHTDPIASGFPREAAGVAIAVGPEGGFTPEEVTVAVANGWRTVSLGPRILRVETAAMAAAVLASARQ